MADSPRKRGAQPGNHNALKHGFYSKKFTPEEVSDLDTLETADLTSEISLLRVGLRRIFDATAHPSDTEAACQALAILGQAASRLANLLKVQIFLQGGKSSEVAKTLISALGEFFQEDGRHG